MVTLKFSTGFSTVDLDLSDNDVSVIDDTVEPSMTIEINLGGEPGNLAEPYILLLLRVCSELLPQGEYERRQNTMFQLVNASIDMLRAQVFKRWKEANHEG